MVTRYLERRRFIRVPAEGPVVWRSGRRSGHAELVDLSPGGVGIRMPLRRSTQLGREVTIGVELGPEEKGLWPATARVVRRVADDDGQCLVGLEFAEIV